MYSAGSLFTLLTLALLVGLGVSYYVWSVRDARHWVEVYASSGHRPDATARRYHMLRREGVRCKMRVVGGTSRGIGFVGQTVSLIVHKDDVARAYQIMARIKE